MSIFLVGSTGRYRLMADLGATLNLSLNLGMKTSFRNLFACGIVLTPLSLSSAMRRSCSVLNSLSTLPFAWADPAIMALQSKSPSARPI